MASVAALAACFHYKPAVTTTTEGADPPVAAASAGFLGAGPTFFNEQVALTNSAKVISIGMYADASCTLVMKIMRRNSSTNVDVIASQSFSHPGGGWSDLTLTTPVTLGGGLDQYYAGACFQTDPAIKYNATNQRAIATTNITGNSQTTVESNGICPSFRVTYG